MVEANNNVELENSSSLKIDFTKITDKQYITDLDNSFDTGLNQVIVDNVLSDLANNISTLSNLSYDEKQPIADLILNLWKHDKNSDQVHRDDKVYEKLIYELYQGADISNTSMKTKELEYTTIKNFADDVRTIYLNFLQKQGFGKVDGNNQIEKFKQDVFTKDFINKIQEHQRKYINNSSIQVFCQRILSLSTNKQLSGTEIKNQIEASFNELDNTVDATSSNYTKEKNSYDKQVNKQKNDKSLIASIAQIKGVDLGAKSNENYKEMKDTVLDHISKIEKVADKNLSFGKGLILRGLDQARKNINAASEPDLPSVIKTELQRAEKVCKDYPDLAGPLLPSINAALNDPKLKLSLSSSVEQQSQITWETILNSTDQQASSFNKFATEPQYKQAYDDVFDIMYRYLVLKTATFRGADISLTQNNITNFKNLITSQLPPGATPLFDKLDLSYVNKSTDTGKLSHYLDGMRVIVIPYMTKEGKFTGYVTFGDNAQVQKDLAKGLEEGLATKKIKKFFTKIPEITDANRAEYGDYVDNVGKLLLDAHGGSEALRILFKNKKEDLLSYFKENKGENLTKFLNDILPNTPEIQRFYILATIECIQGDKELVRVYMNSLKTNPKFLGDDFVTKQLVSEKLFALTQGNNSMFTAEKDAEIFTQITSLKATVDVQAQGVNKPKSLEEQVKMYVGVLFQHPIGKMLLQFLDSFFGGKGGLLKRFGKIPGFSEALNNEFVKQYGFDADQKKVLEKFNFSPDPADNTIINSNDGKNIIDSLKTISASFKKEKNQESIINNFEINPKLLDANLLSSYYLANKGNDKLKTVPYESLFVVDSATQKPSIKADVNKDSISKLLKLIIEDSNTHKVIIDSDLKLKSGYKNTKTLFDKDLFGITNQFDYAKALAAYLMGGSKGDGNFHYVLSENDVSGEKPVDVTQKPEDQVKEEYNEKKRKVGNQLSIVNGVKYNDFDISYYVYDNSNNTSHQKDYQNYLLKPMSELFLGITTVGSESKNNFDLFLSDFTSQTIDKDSSDDIKNQLYHFKNMFIYLQKANPGLIDIKDSFDLSKFDFSLFTSLSKSVDGKKLVFSNNQEDIELTYESNKLVVTYIKKEQQTAAAQVT